MSGYILALVGLVAFAASFTTYGMVLWLASRIWRQTSTLASCMSAAGIISLLQLLLATAIFGWLMLSLSERAAIASLTWLIGSSFIVLAVVMRWLRVTFLRAVGVGLTASLAHVFVASLLAAVLRMYVVEAFVVPTGAMANAIYGAHLDVQCESCSHTFAVSASDRLNPQWGDIEDKVTRCPLCDTQAVASHSAPLIEGDRVLVDRTRRKPRRWQLAVFDNPEAPEVKYIKRAVGLPNETIELAGGEVFVDGSIARKGYAVSSMWLPVYDAAHVSSNSNNSSNAWQSEEGDSSWQFDGDSWMFNASDTQQVNGKLRFARAITSRLAYNGEVLLPDASEHQPVGDVKVTFLLDELVEEASLGVQTVFGSRTVTATLAGSGTVQLTAKDGLDDAPPPVEAVGNLNLYELDAPVCFIIRDGQAAILHGEQVLVEVDVTPKTPEQARRLAIAAGAMQNLTLVASGGTIALSQLTIHRDVYYLSHEELGLRWGMPDIASFPIKLETNEYLMLGDNSRQSKDSRFWGAVDASALHGIASWIYSPTNRMGRLD